MFSCQKEHCYQNTRTLNGKNEYTKSLNGLWLTTLAMFNSVHHRFSIFPKNSRITQLTAENSRIIQSTVNCLSTEYSNQLYLYQILILHYSEWLHSYSYDL